jgi:effector-binding domain-containing protein
MAGPPFCRYTAWRERDCDIEGGCPVVGEVQGSGEVLAGTLGGMRALMGEYSGPYDGLGSAHEAIRTYIGEHGLEASEAPFEIYVTDPEEEPDPSKWITNVYWPIA